MTLPARPLLDVMRGIAEECDTPEECLEVAVAREHLPQSAMNDGVVRYFSWRETKRSFVQWTSLGWATILRAEALAAEYLAWTRPNVAMKGVMWVANPYDSVRLDCRRGT